MAYHIVVTVVLIAQKIPPNVQTLFSHFDDDHDGFIELGLLLPPLTSVVLHVFSLVRGARFGMPLKAHSIPFVFVHL